MELLKAKHFFLGIFFGVGGFVVGTLLFSVLFVFLRMVFINNQFLQPLNIVMSIALYTVFAVGVQEKFKNRLITVGTVCGFLVCAIVMSVVSAGFIK